MKKKFSTSVFAFLALSFSWTVSLAQDTVQPITPAKASIRGETYSYKLSDTDFADTPSWKEEIDEPPLSVSKAVQIARQTLPRFVQNTELWKINRINLQTISRDKWFYAIYFTCMNPQCRNLPERTFMSVVKMNGTIVEPKKLVEQ